MSDLTKDQLRSELVNHGITPPPSSSKKEEFVKLYQKHVAPKQEAAGEFSSDDEAPVERHLNGDAGSVSSTNTDVSDLTNDELSKKLKSFGVDVGPIVGTTRVLYERKLANLLGGGELSPRAPLHGTSAAPVMTNGGGEEFSDSEEEAGGEDRDPTPPPAVETRRRSGRYQTSLTSNSAEASRRSSPRKPVAASYQPLDTSDVTDSSAVRSVFLKDAQDQPSPRRSLKDVRGSYSLGDYVFSKEAPVTAETRSLHSSAVASGPAEETGRRLRPGVHLLIRFGLLLLLITALYFCYQNQKESDSMRSLQKAVQGALERVTGQVKRLFSSPPQPANQ